MREIVFDVEATGLDVYNDKIIEIGCLEIVNLVPTGRTFHRYINPQKEISKGAFKVHGISNEFLYDKPTFAQVANDFLDFIGDDPMVAHNGLRYDGPILNEELKRNRFQPLTNEIVDTWVLAKQVKKGGLHNLDALCSHFHIDNSKRKLHGALLDAEILAEVYLALRGGRQHVMDLAVVEARDPVLDEGPRYGRRPFTSRITDEEMRRHQEFVESLGPTSIWARYLAQEIQQEAA